jgi:GntR family transcriptional regulator
MTPPRPSDARPRQIRVADDLRMQIEAGDLQPGDRLPTLADLAKTHRCSLTVIRRALDLLRQQGLVITRQGKGSFVRRHEPVVYKPQDEAKPPKTKKMDRFMQEREEEGRTGSQTIDVTLIPPPPLVAERLHTPTGELVVARTRVRSINDVPVNTNDTHFPLDVVQGTAIMVADDIADGTNDYLAGLGYPQARVIDQYWCRMPTPDEAERLELGQGTPVFVHVATGYTADGRPVRCTINVLPGDRHTIVYNRRWEWPPC